MNWKHLILSGGLLFWALSPMMAQIDFLRFDMEGTWTDGGCSNCNDNNPATVDSCWGGGCANFVRNGPPLVEVDELGVGRGMSGIVWARNSKQAIRWDGSSYEIFGDVLNPGPTNSTYVLNSVPAVDSNGDAWISGRYTLPSGLVVPFVARYSGGQWSHFTLPNTSNQNEVIRMGVTTNNDLWLLDNENQAWFYDGQAWTTYNLIQVLGLNFLEFTRGLYVDDNDNLILVSTGSAQIRIHSYDGNTWQTISSQYNASDSIRDVLRTPNGAYWVALGDHGLMKYDGSWVRYHTSLFNFAVDYVHRISRGSANNIWLTDIDYLVEFDGSQWTTIAKPNVHLGDGIGGLAFHQPTQTLYATRDVQNGLGFRPVNHGFSIFAGQGWSTSNVGATVAYKNFNRLHYSPQGELWQIPYWRVFASNNLLLSSTSLPLVKSPGQNWQFAHEFGEQVTDIAWDANGGVWFSSTGYLYNPAVFNRHALIYFDGNTYQYYNYTNSPFSGVREVEVDKSGLVWVLDHERDLWRYDGSAWVEFPGNYFRILADAQQGLWVLEQDWTGPYSTDFTSVNLQFHDGQTLTTKIVHQAIGYYSDWMAADLNGGVWLQKFEDGITYFDGQNTTQFPAFPILGPRHRLKTIHVDQLNHIWVGGFGKRLYRYNRQTWDTLDYSDVAVFPDSVLSMVSTSSGKMWATGPSTLDSIDFNLGPATTVSFSMLDSSFIVLDSVWPGDANDDGIANNVDILALGLAYGANGFNRPNASLNWFAQPASNWVQEFILLGDTVNKVHADTDGDGLTGINDTLAIHLNYGFTHNKTNSFSANACTLSLLPTQDSVTVGDSLEVIIQLGNALVPADSIYGIAFSVAYDAALVDSGSVQASFSSSWLGNKGTDMITLAKDFYLDERIELALSRTNQQDRTGYGEIARLKIIMIDDISGKNFLYDTLKLRLENVTLIGRDGNEIPYSIIDAEVIASQELSTSTGDLSEQYEVKIYPNPTTDWIYLDFSHRFAERCDLKLYNLNGQLLKKESFFTEQKKINLTDLPAGIYLLHLQIGEDSYQQKLILGP